MTDVYKEGFDKLLTRELESGTSDSTLTNPIQPSQILPGSLDLGKIQILPDENTGFIAKDSAESDVFKIITGGDDEGDVILGDIDSDYVKWDKSTGELTINGYAIQTKGRFGGDASDGDKTVSTTEELNPTYQVYNWDNLTIDSGQTLSFGSNFQNKIIHIKVAGDCTINGTLSVKGMGSLGGAGGAAGAGDVPGGGTGTDGSDGSDALVYFDTNDKTGKGGEKGSVATGGAAGATMPITAGNSIMLQQKYKCIIASSGTGGAGGGGGQGASAGSIPTPGAGGAGGAGGNGGGFLILEVLGNLTRGAAGVIELDGNDGTAGSVSPANAEATGGGGGGGAGGAGGMGAILYSGTLTDSGSTTVAGGSGGSGGVAAESAGSDTGGQGGGGGGSGGFWNSAGNAGSNGSAGVSEDGGDGGAGGAGVSGLAILESNSNFG